MTASLRHAGRVLVALLLPSAPLAAQARYTLAPYVSQDRALPGDPTLWGLSLTSWAGVFGIRASGALGDLRTERFSDNSSRTRPGAWSADADLVLSPAQSRSFRMVFGGLEPAGFVGFGTHGIRTDDGSLVRTPTWSWGGSLTSRIAGPLAVETEARWRKPVSVDERDPIPDGFTEDWEFKAGLAIRFGGGGSHRGRGRDDHWYSSGASRARTPSVSMPSRGKHGGSAGSRTSASRVLDTGDDYLGTRYVYGGTSPGGFDCSGFVQYVYARHGVSLPRTSRQQSAAGNGIAASVRSLRAGDLVFFSSNGGRIDHVAIYAGDNRILHSTSSGGGVRYDDLDSRRGRWFVDHMVAARRVLDPQGRSLIQDYLDSLPFDGQLDPPDKAPATR
jgi:cell wall-associated NlpC family hydrolase